MNIIVKYIKSYRLRDNYNNYNDRVHTKNYKMTEIVKNIILLLINIELAVCID